jgi:ferredoxin--NADP+ reductase
MRAAVVGAGPAGFFAAGALLDADRPLQVDVFERLPTPWGLVRLGVAPDHPKIKSVSRVFEQIAERPGFRFFGNVEVGRDVTHDELRARYHAVVYAVGARAARALDVPGEELPGSLAASSFVAWYNGDPDHAALVPDLSCERAVVVGNGNVALDVARMLALPADELAQTDIADHALTALERSAIREIVVLGRRGPAQASFTNPELRELGELADTGVVVDPADLDVGDVAEANARRNLETLRGWASADHGATERSIHLRFLVSPVGILGRDRVEGVQVVSNRLETRGDGTVVATHTAERETIRCGLVLASVGYRGVRIPGVPFDQRRGTIPSNAGRVAPGVYCTGWIRRGPSGVIGTNKKDAAEAVGALLADARAGLLPIPSGRPVEELVAARGLEVVDLAGWSRIDAAERERGRVAGRPRVKLCSREDLLGAAFALPPAVAANY